MKEFAPIALFVYNRVGHLEKTINSLSNCIGSEKTELIIFSDGPNVNRENDELLVGNVRKFIRDVTNFKSVQIIESVINIGLYNSIISGLNHVFGLYDTVIVVEDDLIFNENFILYHNQALTKYRDNLVVDSISGYSYNLPFKFLRSSNYFLNTFSCLGWSTWKNRWDLIEFNNKRNYEILESNFFKRLKFDFFGGKDNTRILKNNRNNSKKKSWAIEVELNRFLKKKIQLFPEKSLVNHIGYDSLGTNYSIDNPYNDKELDRKYLPVKFPVDSKVSALNYSTLILFFGLNKIRLFALNRLKK